MPAMNRGFTLLELICVCAVIGLLLAVASPPIGLQVLRARVAAETRYLHELGSAARASFESTDLEGTNLAALPGSVPPGIDCTQFSPSTDPGFVPATTNPYDWFAKLAQQLGSAPQIGVAPTSALQPQVARILVNPSGNTRFMLAGPATEPAGQRFLIVSLIAPAGELATPPLPNPANPQDPANLGLFEDIWNTDWTNPAAVLPASWTAALTAAQTQAWNGGRHLWQLCVERIVCPKFTLTINNTHPTDNCYVAYDVDGQASLSVTAAANSGTTVVGGLYYGRLIQASRGATPATAQLFDQFTLRDNGEINLQD